LASLFAHLRAGAGALHAGYAGISAYTGNAYLELVNASLRGLTGSALQN